MSLQEELDEFLADAERPPDYYGPDEEELTVDQARAVYGLAPIDVSTPTRRPPWKIADDGAADWCLRKLAKALAAQAAVRLLMQERLRNLNAWESAALAGPRADEAHWRGLLEEYGVRRRQATQAASVKLPNGIISTVKSGEVVEIASEKELLAFLEANPKLLKTWCKIEPEPQVSRFKGDVKIVDGSLCEFCLWPIIPVEEGIWVSKAGVLCSVLSGDGQGERLPQHKPQFMEDGERVAHRVVTFQGEDGLVVVPGLSVRPEKITPHARVDA